MFTDYRPSVGYDEYFSDQSASPRADLAPLLTSLGQMGLPELNRNHASASHLLRRLGATFRLNDSGLNGGERILPFDPLPRLISRRDWAQLERGLLQRLEAIDCFLADVYGPQRILNDKVIPRQDVESSSSLVLCNSSMMSSLRRKTTRKSKKVSSAGCLWTKAI